MHEPVTLQMRLQKGGRRMLRALGLLWFVERRQLSRQLQSQQSRRARLYQEQILPLLDTNDRRDAVDNSGELQRVDRIIRMIDMVILQGEFERMPIRVPDEWLEAGADGVTLVLKHDLNTQQRRELRRMISEGWFARWQKWVGLLVPVLSLLVALAALLAE